MKIPKYILWIAKDQYDAQVILNRFFDKPEKNTFSSISFRSDSVRFCNWMLSDNVGPKNFDNEHEMATRGYFIAFRAYR